MCSPLVSGRGIISAIAEDARRGSSSARGSDGGAARLLVALPAPSAGRTGATDALVAPVDRGVGVTEAPCLGVGVGEARDSGATDTGDSEAVGALVDAMAEVWQGLPQVPAKAS